MILRNIIYILSSLANLWNAQGYLLKRIECHTRVITYGTLKNTFELTIKIIDKKTIVSF